MRLWGERWGSYDDGRCCAAKGGSSDADGRGCGEKCGGSDADGRFVGRKVGVVIPIMDSISDDNSIERVTLSNIIELIVNYIQHC